MDKLRIYITKKNQIWTMGEKEALLEYLDGEDDEILQFAVPDKDFAIILKNDLTPHSSGHGWKQRFPATSLRSAWRWQAAGPASAGYSKYWLSRQ